MISLSVSFVAKETATNLNGLSSNGLPWSLRVCWQCGRPGFDPWVGKIPQRRKWQPTPVLLPGKSHGQRSLVDSPWGHKEPDTNFMFTFKQQQLIISYNSINWLISLLLVVSSIMCIAAVSWWISWGLCSARITKTPGSYSPAGGIQASSYVWYKGPQ